MSIREGQFSESAIYKQIFCVIEIRTVNAKYRFSKTEVLTLKGQEHWIGVARHLLHCIICFNIHSYAIYTHEPEKTD